MKKTYETPEMEILEFEAEVLMMSGDPSIDEGEGGDPFGF